MTGKEFEELEKRMDDLEEKLDKITNMIELYMEESSWFISETAGALVTIQTLYEKKRRC